MRREPGRRESESSRFPSRGRNSRLAAVRALPTLLLPSLALAGSGIPPDPDEAAYPAIERFVRVLEQVRERHPDADQVAYERLVNHALEGMLSSLDPFSSFIHPEMALLLEDDPSLDPHVPSLGITLGLRAEGPYIANVNPGSPAARAFVVPGAAILEIDGSPPPSLPELLAALRKNPGESTLLKLGIPTAPKPAEVRVVHAAVASKVVEVSELMEDGATGYLRLSSFTGRAAREVEAALDELEDRGMKHLILDLRGNPGGDLGQTVEILGLFVPPGTVVVTTRGRGDEAEETLKTPSRQRRKREYPIRVLIDRGSASASELTAAALQDLKRAVVVGETSFGKGSVQQIIPMGGGTALRLTIATYHTPSGRTPHGTGVTPDVAVPLSEDTREKIALSFRRSTLTPGEAKDLENWKDPVIEAARGVID